MNPCSDIFTVVTQADVDHRPLSLCSAFGGTIDIRNATGTLAFPNLTLAYTIYVRDSPQLQVLNFSQLSQTNLLEIDQATSLTDVLLPLLNYEAVLNFTGVPSLDNITLRNQTTIRELNLFDVGIPSTFIDLSNVSFASFIRADNSSLWLTNLKEVSNLEISGPLQHEFDYLASVSNFTLKGISPNRIFVGTALQINETMLLESSRPNSQFDSEIEMGAIGKVGRDLIITSNANVRIMYGGLRDVGGSLSIRNNTNCTFDFSQISTAGSLLVTNNTNTTVPLFPYLSRAESIYIRGFIDTSIGPNIFPALISVSGNVTIEALNDDFDCSKLISQWKEDHIIHNLKCNGQNNETIESRPGSGNATSTPIPTQNPSLSLGIWAGIGIGAGVAVIGILGAFIWIIIHYRRRLRKLKGEAIRDSDEKLSTGEPEQPQVFQMQEVDGRGIFREKPDDPLIEMPTQPAELPTRPQSWAEPKEEELVW